MGEFGMGIFDLSASFHSRQSCCVYRARKLSFSSEIMSELCACDRCQRRRSRWVQRQTSSLCLSITDRCYATGVFSELAHFSAGSCLVQTALQTRQEYGKLKFDVSFVCFHYLAVIPDRCCGHHAFGRRACSTSERFPVDTSR